MKRSTERILTTHTGSLPRPKSLLDLVGSLDQREVREDERFHDEVQRAITEIVRKQVEVGVDVVSDGEMSKVSYSTYVVDRLTGFEGESRERPHHLEVSWFPDYYLRRGGRVPASGLKTPPCAGPIAWRGAAQVHPSVTWAKFQSLTAGARIASKQLWG